ncbi:MAG: DUF2235 domain-containing protein, partial [Kiritimatiellae bacterium]|nr:DUF2235 domain-containing protein [Kiritimatiellia bacterium]
VLLAFSFCRSFFCAFFVCFSAPLSRVSLFFLFLFRFVSLFDQVPSKLGLTRSLCSSVLNASLSGITLGALGYNPYERVSDSSGDFSFTLPKGMTFENQPLHLVALDEQRREFAVTDVQGALQVGFRGVHSNVGGGYNNDFLAYISRRFVYDKAKKAGLEFFDEKWAASDPLWEALYDYHSSGMAGDRLSISPTDNSAVHWDDKEKRRLPKDMLLHQSVNWFDSAPKNSIKGYGYLP